MFLMYCTLFFHAIFIIMSQLHRYSYEKFSDCFKNSSNRSLQTGLHFSHHSLIIVVKERGTGGSWRLGETIWTLGMGDCLHQCPIPVQILAHLTMIGHVQMANNLRIVALWIRNHSNQEGSVLTAFKSARPIHLTKAVHKTHHIHRKLINN